MVWERLKLRQRRHLTLLLLFVAGILMLRNLPIQTIIDFRPNLNQQPSKAPSIHTSALSILTFNLWRLCDPKRVPLLVEAFDRLDDEFEPEPNWSELPDILLFQEIECESSTSLLKQNLSQTHWFESHICAWKHSGSPRSGIAIAINQTRFKVLKTSTIDLGSLVGDHARCALKVTVKSSDNDRELHIINVHHSPHPNKYKQTQNLVEALENLDLLEADNVILGGDFNFNPSSPSYDLVTKFFDDPYRLSRGKTHWIGGRIDIIFIGRGLSLIQPLSRATAYDMVRPTKLIRPMYHCPYQKWEECALSDHLPEGGLFRFEDRL